MNEQRNDHLNLFHFYGDNNEQFIENNITRALAICLENDPILFDRFLRKILREQYEDLFVTVGESADVTIGIQVKCSDFQGVKKVIGVPLTEDELILHSGVVSYERNDPITDLSIQINENLIVFEVKRSPENCLGQLKNQLEKIVEYSDGEIQIDYYKHTFSWGILMDLWRHTLKFQRDVNNENLFTQDFHNFLKRNYPQWFRNIPFGEIEFPDDLKANTKLRELLEVRLNVIKHKMIELWNNERGREDELVFSRDNIPVPSYKWANEINIEPIQVAGENYIAIKIWPGDTKGQGQHIYKKGKTFQWTENIKGYDLIVQPQLKFAGRKGICWLKTKQSSNLKTHTDSFFWDYTGRWKRDDINSEWTKAKVKWKEFDQILEEVNLKDENWKKSTGFHEKVQKSNRTVFDVSAGFAVEVRIPYNKIREIDRKHQKDPTQLAQELKRVSEELLRELEEQFI